MKFDLNVFKTYFGNIYIKNMKRATTVFFISLLVFIILILLKINIPYFLAIILGMMIFISAFLVAVFYCDYKKHLERAKRQKVWFHNNKLNIKFVPVSGFTWGAIEHHSYHYVVESINNIQMNDRFILVNGNIFLTENDNGRKKQNILTEIKIPRTFLNEEKILQLKEDYHE